MQEEKQQFPIIGTGRIKVVVSSSQQPVQNAAVRIIPPVGGTVPPKSGVTDAQGTVEFVNSPQQYQEFCLEVDYPSGGPRLRADVSHTSSSLNMTLLIELP
jgi:hypothetical protein